MLQPFRWFTRSFFLVDQTRRLMPLRLQMSVTRSSSAAYAFAETGQSGAPPLLATSMVTARWSLALDEVHHERFASSTYRAIRPSVPMP